MAKILLLLARRKWGDGALFQNNAFSGILYVNSRICGPVETLLEVPRRPRHAHRVPAKLSANRSFVL
jgi:hypothetical protein